ncbi:MAG: hypothetical protein VB857_16665, partial [Pirellulaceae bacterium]
MVLILLHPRCRLKWSRLAATLHGDSSCAALAGARGWFYLQPVASFYFRQGGEGVVRILGPFYGSQRFPTFSPGLLEKVGVCTCRT